MESKHHPQRGSRRRGERQRPKKRIYAIIAKDGLFAMEPLSHRLFRSKKRALNYLARITRGAPANWKDRVILGRRTKAGWRVAQ